MKRKMISRTMLSLVAATALSTTAVACGSDDDEKETPTTQADSGTDTTAAGADTESTQAGGGDGETSNAEVEEFCETAEELGEQLEDAMANPTGADVASITSQAQELSAQAAQLSTANPEQAERITECAQALNPAG